MNLVRLLFPLAPALSPLGKNAWARRNFPAFLAVLLICLACAIPAAARAIDFPALTGRVVDEAGMFSRAEQANMEARLRELEDKSSDQLVVVTLKSLRGLTIERYGVELARHWGIGRKDKNNGVLLIIAPKERKLRIEVGYGLEGELTDTLASNIIHNRIVPMFRRGKMAEGVKVGIEDIIGVLTGDKEAVAERAKGRRRGRDGNDWLGMAVFAIWLIMFLFILSNIFLRRRAARRGGVVIVPVPVEVGRGGWHGGGGFGGGYGGGFGGGGGFSGGGGGFGGGGASGGW